MIDCKGRELNIGDRVLFTIGDNIREGVIHKMMPQQCDVELEGVGYRWNKITNVYDTFPQKQIERVRYPIYQIFKLGDKE